MDSDGHCSKKGDLVWVQKRNRLTDDFCELLSSLGLKYRRVKRTINNRVYNFVKFKAFADTHPCFRLKRKLARMHTSNMAKCVGTCTLKILRRCPQYQCDVLPFPRGWHIPVR